MVEDLRNIIGHGKNQDGSKWYIVSDRSKTSGRLYRGAGQKVTVNQEDYSCSCRYFKDAHGECIHIESLKFFEEALETKKQAILPQKEEEIRQLSEKIKELESERKNHSEENLFEIGLLQAELQEKEAEYHQSVQILETQAIELEERVIKETKEREKFSSIASGLSKSRFACLYELPKETQDLIVSLADLKPKHIDEALSHLVYLKIPVSKKDYQKKIDSSFYNDHQPKLFREFVEQIAKISTVDQINFSWQESAKETRIKNIYQPKELMACGKKSDGWTIHLVYSNNNFGSNLYLKTTARDQKQAELIAEIIQEKI